MKDGSIQLGLPILHYLSPILVLVYFQISRTLATCLLHKPTKRAGEKSRKYPAAAILLAVVVTLVAQATVSLASSLRNTHEWPVQDVVVYMILSIFAYGSLVLNVLENKAPIWHPFLGACAVGFVIETAITGVQFISPREDIEICFTCLALQVTRALSLLAFCLLEGWATLHDRPRKIHLGDESEQLLANGSTQHANRAMYGAASDEPANKEDSSDSDSVDIDSEEDAPESYKRIRKQQRKRLQDSGNWLNYVKEFKIFIPILWPSKDRFVQACIGAIGLVLVAERFLNVLVPRQLGIITNKLTAGNGNGIVPWNAVGVWMALSFLNSRTGITLIRSLAELPVQQFSYRNISSKSFAHIMNLSMDFHNEKSTGELIRAIEQGHQLHGLVELIFYEVGPMLADLFIAFVYVYTLFDVYMSLILGFVGVAYIWLAAKTTSWSIKRRRRFNIAWRNESKVQNEAIGNWQTVSHFNRGKYECQRYGETIDEFCKSEMSYFIVNYLGGDLQSIVMVLGRLSATTLAIYRVAQGTAPVGHFITLITYWRNVEGPLHQMSWSIRRITQLLTDSERLLQLFQTKPSITDAPNAVEIKIDEGHVEFDHVEFAYDARRPTLKDISFKAKPGQTIALVGETGGGKSTILKLLYRYYDATTGAIRIDGQDIRGVTLDSLRDSFGMVPQDPALFNITILENVRYARLDATDEEVKDACRAAAIHDKIESFPDGYSSTVGERGVKLSGGELQRVSIARAILRRPKIVLLDEATSMIDAETEAVIQDAFKRLTARRTTFMIAHRLSTIQHADLILVIGDGNIIESGTHEELLRLGGKYVALWSKQLSRDVGATVSVDQQGQALIDLEDVEGPQSRHLDDTDDSDESD